MESRFYTKNDTRIRLLPTYFKWIGLAIMLLAGVSILVIKLFNVEFSPNQKDTFLIFVSRFFLLGLFIIALARDKIEDELTLLLRLKAMACTFFVVIATIILQPLLDLIWKDPLQDMTPAHLVLRMLIFYHVLFFVIKKFR